MRRTQPFVLRWRRAIGKSDLPMTTLAVLRALAEWMDSDGGGCFPSQKIIAASAKASEETVRKHLKLAEKKGWIIKGHAGWRGRGWKRCAYRATLPDVTSSAAGKAGEEADMQRDSGVRRTQSDAADVPNEVGAYNNSPDNSSNTRDHVRESTADPAKAETAFWRWLHAWPKPPEKTPRKALGLWLAMSGAQQDACTALTPAYLRTIKNKGKLCGPERFLREKRWEMLASAAASRPAAREHAPYGGKLWMSWWLWLLLQPPSGLVKFTAFDEGEIAAGRAERETILRAKLRANGWPAANAMLETYRQKQKYYVKSVMQPVSSGFAAVKLDGDIFAAWRRLADRRGWPMPEEAVRPVMYFPAVAFSGDLDADVEAALADFERRARGIFDE